MMPNKEVMSELREIFPQLDEMELLRVLAFAQGAASVRAS